MEVILYLILFFPIAYGFILCMAIAEVKKEAIARCHSPLGGSTGDVLKRRKKGEQ